MCLSLNVAIWRREEPGPHNCDLLCSIWFLLITMRTWIMFSLVRPWQGHGHGRINPILPATVHNDSCITCYYQIHWYISPYTPHLLFYWTHESDTTIVLLNSLMRTGEETIDQHILMQHLNYLTQALMRKWTTSYHQKWTKWTCLIYFVPTSKFPLTFKQKSNITL